MSSVAPTADTLQEDQLFGHPKGLYICFATELWERFSFYGMKYLLLLYLTKYHLFTDAMGLDVLGAYAGLVYALPVIGGLLADRYLGFRKAVVFGGVMLSLGHVLMAVEGHQAVNYAAGTLLSEALTLVDGTVLAAGTVLTESIVIRDVAALDVFYLALALIVMGVGFLKPNISTIVGRLYGENDARRDSGFTIFYMGINIGSFTATLLCGWLGETYGWGYGFGAAGIGMILGLITFLWGQKYLYGHAEPSNPERLKESALGPINKEWAIYLGSMIALAAVWWVVQREPVVHHTQNAMLIISGIGLMLYALMAGRSMRADNIAYGLAVATVVFGVSWAFELAHFLPFLMLPVGGEGLNLLVVLTAISGILFVAYGFIRHPSVEYSRMVVLMVLIASTIVFWSLFEQSASSMTLYADRVLDRNVMGGEVRASQFGSLNAGFIILLAPVFAALWIWLSKRGWEPSTPVKFGLGILQVGLGFGALVLGAEFPNEVGKVAAIWLVLAYLLHTTGELCLSPVGLSAVTKLAASRVVGAAMGTWFLATALSETLATRMSKWAAIDTSGGEVQDVAAALTTYTELFEFLMWFGVGAGVFMFLISPLLKKGMHGIH